MKVCHQRQSLFFPYFSSRSATKAPFADNANTHITAHHCNKLSLNINILYILILSPSLSFLPQHAGGKTLAAVNFMLKIRKKRKLWLGGKLQAWNVVAAEITARIIGHTCICG